MEIVGLDISFKRTGICKMNLDNKILTIDKVEGEGGKSFRDIIKRVLIQSKTIISKIGLSKDTLYVIEEPFHGGSFSSGLFALDAVVVNEISKITDSLLFYHPTAIGFYHGTRDYSKTDTVKLAKDLLDVLKEDNWTIKVGRMSHDEADATVYAVITYVLIYGNHLGSKIKELVPKWDVIKYHKI